VAVTLNVALWPTVTVWFTGWVVIVGASDGGGTKGQANP